MDQLMLLKIFAVCSKNKYETHEYNMQLMTLKSDGTHSYNSALKG